MGINDTLNGKRRLKILNEKYDTISSLCDYKYISFYSYIFSEISTYDMEFLLKGVS